MPIQPMHGRLQIISEPDSVIYAIFTSLSGIDPLHCSCWLQEVALLLRLLLVLAASAAVGIGGTGSTARFISSGTGTRSRSGDLALGGSVLE